MSRRAALSSSRLCRRVRSGTRLDLDCDVTEAGETSEPRFVGAWRLRVTRDEHKHRRAVPRADAPHMQVGNAVVSGLQPLRDGRAEGGVGVHVEEDGTSKAHEAPRPIGNDERTDDPHQRVHPPPAEVPTGQQADDGEDGHHSVRQYMDVGGAQVEIMAMTVGAVMVRVIRVFVIVVVMVVTQQPRAEEIDAETKDGDRNRLVEGDRHRVEQAYDTFVPNEERDHGQHNSAGEPGHVAEHAGTKGKVVVAGVAAGVGVGQRRDDQRTGVRGHVQAISEERHGAEDHAADYFGSHHDAAEADDRPGLPLVPCVILPEKNMFVAERRQGVEVQGSMLLHRPAQCKESVLV